MDEERFDRFVEKVYGQLLEELNETNERVRQLESRHDNGIEWNGTEKREYIFSQSQVEWLKSFIEDRLTIAVGAATVRIVLLVAGAVAVAITLLVLGLKHG